MRYSSCLSLPEPSKHPWCGNQWIVHDPRIPRTVLALLVGLALGVSGALIQTVGRNPLADSEILGINSGAALLWSARLPFWGSPQIWTYIWFAFAGALFAMLLVYLVGVTGRVIATPFGCCLPGWRWVPSWTASDT